MNIPIARPYIDRIPAIIIGMREVMTIFGFIVPTAAIAEPALAVPYAAPIPT